MMRPLDDRIVLTHLIKPGETVVVGVSGGADSAALLHLLWQRRQDPQLPFRVVAAHLNHQTRGVDSDTDAEFVQQESTRLGVDCFVEHRNIPEIAARLGLGIEETGRRERYAFFERICLKAGAHVVAVAHHADDQAETVLHRILRGTGLRGLGGMSAVRPLTPRSEVRLVRPMLEHTRAELRAYLDAHKIAFREDSSNQSLEPVRNRIRLNVLPLLEQQINPQVRGALIRLAEQARWFEEYFHESVIRTFETLIVSQSEDTLILNAQAMARKSRLLQTGLIREAYVSLGPGEADLTFDHLVRVSEMVSEPVSGKVIQLPGGVSVEKRYDQLIFTNLLRPELDPEFEPVTLHVPGVTTLPQRLVQLGSEVLLPPAEQVLSLAQAGSPLSEHFDLDALKLPLVVRTRRPGDRFCPLGVHGSKTLSDYLTDAKVPPDERRKIVVVFDQVGPIWIVGHRIDDRVKLKPGTRRVLHIEARNLTP